MGRSKSKRESMTTTTPSKSPSNPPALKPVSPGKEKDLPARSGVKRPMSGNTDSEEEDAGHSITDMLENGFPKSKKGRFVPQEALNLGSADEDEESNEDEGESSDGEEGEDSDVTIDDEDEAEDDDDESDDDDVDLTESQPTESTAKLIQSDLSITATSTRKPEVAHTKSTTVRLTDSMDPEGTTPCPVSDYLLVPNAPKDLSKLQKLLTDRGYSVSDIQLLRVPLVLVSLSKSDNAGALVAASKPLSVDGNTVHFLRLEGPQNALSMLTDSNVTSSVFVAQIPKSVTMELLKSKLPSNCNPISFKLLQPFGNKPFNAAIFHFASKNLATTALKTLSQIKFADRYLRVSYGREMNTTHSPEGLRGSTKCLVASQLPPNVTESQMRTLFTTAVNFKIVTKNGETTCFMNFEDEASAADAFDTHNNSSIGQSKLTLTFGRPLQQTGTVFSADVHNAPPSATVSDILALFPGATSAFHHSQGHYVVQFPSGDVRRTALSGRKSLSGKPLAVYVYGGLEENIGFFKNLPYSSTENDVRSVFPEASKIEIHFRADGRSAGTATIEFPNASVCSAAIKKPCTLNGRRIFGKLERVNVNAEEKRLLTQKAKQKKNEGVQQQETRAVPPPVGSSSEGSSDDQSDEEEEEDEEMSEEKDDLMNQPKGTFKATKNVEIDSGESDGDDATDEEEEVVDEDDESDGSLEESEVDDSAGSDDGSASDEEMPMVQEKFHGKLSGDSKGSGFTPKGGKQRFDGQGTPREKGGFNKNRGGFLKRSGDGGFDRQGSGGFKRGGGDGGGFRRGGGDGGGFKRGGGDGGGFKRGGGDGGGFKRGGDGGGFKRGGGDGGGFKRGGDGGFKRGGGGFKSRGGGFQNRGGSKRGGFRGGKRGKN